VSSPSTPGLKPTAPPASPDYDLGFDVQLRYLCNDAQWPSRPARFAALAAATESFGPYVGPKWTYIGFPCVAWTTRAPGPWNRTTPLLLVNFRYDPATPLSSAVGTARALADTRLITIEGWGHRFFQPQPQHLRPEVRSELSPGEEPATGRDHPPSRLNTLPINRPCTAAASRFARNAGAIAHLSSTAPSGPAGLSSTRAASTPKRESRPGRRCSGRAPLRAGARAPAPRWRAVIVL
jgi:hypothetical protein